MNGYLKVYDITRHDHKQLFHPRSGYDLFENFGEIIAAKCNGSFMAVLLANESLIPDGRVYCWNYQNDTVNYFDFLKCQDAGGGGVGSSDDDKSLFVAKLPVRIYWDTDDHRLLAVQTKVIHVQPSNKKDTKKVVADSQAIIMFESDKGVLNILEAKDLCFGEELINLCIPHLVTLNINAIHKVTMRDFQGMETCDEETRWKIIDFSLHIAEGNMDLAYRCIRTIQSKVVWTNLAKMCVETGRLDVAKVCLGHLQNARSVRALRQAMEDPYLEEKAKVATLATELGMLDKAKELYESCGRYDLVNRLYQAQGDYDKAIAISEEFDRVNLKNTYFQKAEDLKEKGDMKTALQFYEKTQNPVQNITQLLLDDPLMLKEYMEKTTDPKMLKWWGQYIESTGDMENALSIYQKADDWFSQVKILCYLGEIGKADGMARNSGNRAACYHLARHYENIGKYQEAVQFYMRAQTFSNAVRICKEMDLQDELWQVASSSNNKKDKSIAAMYFEDCGMFKKAVELYHKSGMLHKAIDIAFNSEQPETLEVIADELTPDSDKELIERCTEFFMKMGQPQKAVQLLARTKQYEEAAHICLHNNVPVTEALADLLTPSKEELTDEKRTHILMKIAEVLQEQGDYHMATKKFTQAGDKVRAMKSLLKSGDTEKIIFFANMSRQREVYIMAANYLQAHNWQKHPKILKHIVTFYSKGQAYDSLANFYATCAQVEIDEFNDYEKALKAMHEAAKSLSKVPHSQRAADNLQRSIIEVTHVLKVQELLENENYDEAIQQCRSILNKPEVAPIRRSDVLAYLVKALGISHQYIESIGILRELAMKEPHWNRRGILDKGLVEVIARESGVDFEKIWDTTVDEVHDGGDYDEIEENIRE